MFPIYYLSRVSNVYISKAILPLGNIRMNVYRVVLNIDEFTTKTLTQRAYTSVS